MPGRLRTVFVVAIVAHGATALGQSGRIPIRLPGQNAAATPFDLAILHGDEALDHANFAEAQRQFESAAALNPRDARPAFYLGEVAMRQAQWPVAEAHFRDAVRINAQMAEAHAELGNVLREENRSADAITELENAVRLDGTLAEAHASLAMALEDAGQRDRALTEYRSAVRLAPDAPLPSLNLGMFLAATHPAMGTPERSEALRSLLSAVRNGGSDVAVLASAGPALRLIGENATAAQTLERARQMGTPSPSLLAELAQALWANNDHAAGLQRISEAIQAARDRSDLHYLRGLMLAQSGDRPGALAEMRETIRLGGTTPLAQRARQRVTELQRTH